MKTTPTVADAVAFAARMHGDHRDKAGQPCILHPLRVLLTQPDEAAQIVAVLHDVMEDTPVTATDLRDAGYGEKVITALEALTKRKDETYDDFIERVATNPLARRVKLADLEDNMDFRRLRSPTAKDTERMEKSDKAWGRLMSEETRGKANNEQAGAEAEWKLFEKHLAEALSDLAEDEYLILSHKRADYYVQFAAQGAFGMRAETMSNAHITEAADQLSPTAFRTLLRLGWNPPTRQPPESEIKHEPGGSPNYYLDFSSPVPCDEIARLTVRTFREVFGTTHPGFLEYRAFHSKGTDIRFPSLKINREG